MHWEGHEITIQPVVLYIVQNCSLQEAIGDDMAPTLYVFPMRSAFLSAFHNAQSISVGLATLERD